MFFFIIFENMNYEMVVQEIKKSKDLNGGIYYEKETI